MRNLNILPGVLRDWDPLSHTHTHTLLDFPEWSQGKKEEKPIKSWFPHFFFLFNSTEVFYLFIYLFTLVMPEFKRVLLFSSYSLLCTKCTSLGGAGWHFSWTWVTFSLASSSFWWFSFIHFRTLSWFFGCLICSMHTLILLARSLPLTCIFKQCPPHLFK